MVRKITSYAILLVILALLVLAIVVDMPSTVLVGASLLFVGVLLAIWKLSTNRTGIDSFDEYMRKIGEHDDRWKRG